MRFSIAEGPTGFTGVVSTVEGFMVEVSMEGATEGTGNGQRVDRKGLVGKMVARYKVPGYLSVYWSRKRPRQK